MSTENVSEGREGAENAPLLCVHYTRSLGKKSAEGADPDSGSGRAQPYNSRRCSDSSNLDFS